jgi:mRNA-degrading endonuclease RelE of RelBE toxin-antitoxin system
MTIKLSVQVAEFLRSLTPEPRRRLRLAIRSLAQGRGDIKALEGDLGGYCRLRVGSYRVIFWQGATVIECVYAERRSIIYEIFAEELRRKLADK